MLKNIYPLLLISLACIIVYKNGDQEYKLIDSDSLLSYKLPKYYATINQGKSESDLDYRRLKIKFGNYSDYEFQRFIGQGASGHAYLGLQRTTKTKVVIKTFKNLKWNSIKREINFMQLVQGHELISPLVDVITNNNTVSLVYNRYIVFPTSQLMRTMTDNGNRALDYIHSKGVIHADLKPANVICNLQTQLFKLIDWGLSMYYVPGRSKSPTVGTKSYQSPEVLLRYQYYDYEIDVYAAGFMFASMIFKDNNPFKSIKKNGSDKLSYINRIAIVFGSQGFKELSQKFKSTVDLTALPNYEPVNLKKFINKQNAQYCSPDALDLLYKLMEYDPVKRITPKDALKHSYFDQIRD